MSVRAAIKEQNCDVGDVLELGLVDFIPICRSLRIGIIISEIIADSELK